MMMISFKKKLDDVQLKVHAYNFTCAELYISDDALNSLDDKIVGKWRKYFQLKSAFYTSTVSLQ